MLCLGAHGASDSQRYNWLRMPLEHAVAEGNLDIVVSLLEAGANGASGLLCDGSRSLLDMAVSGGNAKIVEALVRAGSREEVNSVDSGEPPLHSAARRRYQEVGRSLIIAGARVDAQHPTGVVAMHLAAAKGCHYLVNDLLLRGALRYYKHPSGRLPLHIAAHNGHARVIMALLAAGVCMDILDDCNNSALMIAIRRARLRAMGVLLTAGASLNVSKSDSTPSALELAARQGRVDVLRVLVRFGADVLASNNEGWTALHEAAGWGNRGKGGNGLAVGALLKAGANVNALDSRGMTPLHCVANIRSCKVGTARALLKGGADVEARDCDGETPLLVASSRSNAVVVEELLRWDADWTAQNNVGQTPEDVMGHRTPSRAGLASVVAVKFLLARAPANRMWRRRGWFVMTRCRPQRVQTLHQIFATGDKPWASKESYGGDAKMARTIIGRKGDGGRAECAGSERDKERQRGEADRFAELVARVVSLQADEVFRGVLVLIG